MAIAVEEMKTALEEISSVFDGLIDRLGSGSKVFIKVDEWLGLSTRDAFMRVTWPLQSDVAPLQKMSILSRQVG